MNLYRKLFSKLMDEAPADGAAAASAAPAVPAVPDTTPIDPAAAAAPADGAAAPVEKVIPEDYAITAPENVIMDGEITDLFKSTSKELNLSQDEADKMANVGFKILEKQQQAAVAEVEKWKQAVETDPVLGGANLEANHAIAEAGVDAIASPELKQLLIQTGMSNHPEVFRAFHKLGLMVKDDSFISGGSRSATTETTRAERMFGKKS